MKRALALAIIGVLLPLTASAFSFTHTLSVGMQSEEVRVLQTILKEKGYFQYPEITGYFGAATWKAVAAYQQDNNLEAVGYVGPKTRALLNSLNVPATTSLNIEPPSQSSTSSTTAPPIFNLIDEWNKHARDNVGLGYTPGFGGGGGGGASVSTQNAAPETKISINLMTDTATVDGVSVAINTLLGSDPVSGTYWYTTDYISGNRTSEGLTGDNGTSPAFIGTAKTRVLAGSTIVMEWKEDDSYSDGLAGIKIVNEHGNNFVDMLIDPPHIVGNGSDQFYSVGVVNIINSDADGEVNKFAATLTPTRGAVSANGSAVDTKAMGTDWPIDDSPYAWIRLRPGMILRKIDIYQVKDDSELPTLSAL